MELICAISSARHIDSECDPGFRDIEERITLCFRLKRIIDQRLDSERAIGRSTFHGRHGGMEGRIRSLVRTEAK